MRFIPGSGVRHLFSWCGMMCAILLEEEHMELSLRLDTLGMVEVRYLRGSSFFPLLSFLPPLPTLFLPMSPHKEFGADSRSDRRWSGMPPKSPDHSDFNTS